MTNPQLTDTELETLAAMLHSASKHMTSVRTADGRYPWDSQYLDALTDMHEGFYALQTDPWRTLVHI